MFKEKGALLEGHFQLSSGLHSSMYLQSALVLSDTDYAEKLGKFLADKIKTLVGEIDLVVAPAMGGLIIGHEVARSLGKDFIFTERVDGEMSLRRGFSIKEGSSVVIIEDVFTTGKSTREVIKLLNDRNVNVVACGSIIDRSGGSIELGVPYVSLLSLEIKNYEEKDCPMCKEGKKIEKPGSRFLKK